MTSEEAELREAIERVVTSKSPKKLIVAGPGAGKTTLFKRLLKVAAGESKNRLVLTFINSLKDDLESSSQNTLKSPHFTGFALVFSIAKRNYGMDCRQSFPVSPG